MQAKEQYRAGKERKKPDRVVFDCQERAYWVVHRPPGGALAFHDWTDRLLTKHHGTFLTHGAPRWINIDGKTMEVTVKGLKHPHRYVLDAADTHLHADEEGLFRRYLKSLVFKDTQKRAICPDQHMFSVSQLEANARKRRPSISTIIARQLEQEERARMATRGPVDITQVMSKLSNKGKEVPPSKK